MNGKKWVSFKFLAIRLVQIILSFCRKLHISKASPFYFLGEEIYRLQHKYYGTECGVLQHFHIWKKNVLAIY